VTAPVGLGLLAVAGVVLCVGGADARDGAAEVDASTGGRAVVEAAVDGTTAAVVTGSAVQPTLTPSNPARASNATTGRMRVRELQAFFSIGAPVFNDPESRQGTRHRNTAMTGEFLLESARLLRATRAGTGTLAGPDPRA
jgi:hypothetical protein